MDLIDKIKRILTENGLKSPSFDLHYDNQDNVIGHVVDEFFEGKDDETSQKFIWDNLKKFLAEEELIRIFTIFHESPIERVARLIALTEYDKVRNSKIWTHTTPDGKKYWLFIGIARFGENYKTFFLIINYKDNFTKKLTLEYPKDIIDFMELEQEEIYKELYDKILENAEAEVKFHIMSNYERLTEKGLFGKYNMFHYVFNEFQLKPMPINKLLFDDNEIAYIRKALTPFEDFSEKKDIELALERSETISYSR